MGRRGNGDCTCGDFSWVDNIPVDQMNLVKDLLYAGFRVACVSLNDEDKERSHQLLDAIACHAKANTHHGTP